MENMQHGLPHQLKWLLDSMSVLEAEPTRDTMNKILYKAVIAFFKKYNMLDILRVRYKEKFNMPWFEDFFGEEVNPVGVDKVEEIEEDLLAEKPA